MIIHAASLWSFVRTGHRVATQALAWNYEFKTVMFSLPVFWCWSLSPSLSMSFSFTHARTEVSTRAFCEATVWYQQWLHVQLDLLVFKSKLTKQDEVKINCNNTPFTHAKCAPRSFSFHYFSLVQTLNGKAIHTFLISIVLKIYLIYKDILFQTK